MKSKQLRVFGDAPEINSIVRPWAEARQLDFEWEGWPEQRSENPPSGAPPGLVVCTLSSDRCVEGVFERLREQFPTAPILAIAGVEEAETLFGLPDGLVDKYVYRTGDEATDRRLIEAALAAMIDSGEFDTARMVRAPIVCRALRDQSMEEFYVFSRDGRLLFFNETAEQVHRRQRGVGLRLGEAASSKVLESVREAFAENLERAVNGETVVVCRNVAESADSENWKEYSYRPVIGADDRVDAVAMSVRDLTEQRQIESRIRHADKMQAIGQLAGAVAHDFNNVLTVVESYAYLAETRLADEDPSRSSVARIRDATARGSRLTRQLLEVSPERTGEPEWVDVAETLGQLDGLLQRVMRRNISMRFRLSDELADVRMDLGQFEQIVMNLVLNARDAMPDGGELTVDASAVVFGESNADERPAGITSGEYLLLAVEDTGVGMDEQTRSHIFEPFFTTKGVDGSGLGLSTVYGLVSKTHGTITVDSEPGDGTTFCIYLPGVVDRERDEPQPVEESSSSRGPRPVGDKVVMVVEDEKWVRQPLAELLDQEGYRVVTFKRGEEALAWATADGVEVDLVLTDVVLPRMNGIELASRLSERRPDIQCVFISGYPGEEMFDDAQLDDVVVLPKPYDIDQMLDVVGGLLSEESSTARQEALSPS